MNLLDALLCVRNVAAQSPQMATRQGQAALKVIDKKIRGLQRKKAWRDCRGSGTTPDHMIDPNHPLNEGMKVPPLFPSGTVAAGFPNVVPMYSERGPSENKDCTLSGHDLEEGYYGHTCKRCRAFFPNTVPLEEQLGGEEP